MNLFFDEANLPEKKRRTPAQSKLRSQMKVMRGFQVRLLTFHTPPYFSANAIFSVGNLPGYFLSGPFT